MGHNIDCPNCEARMMQGERCPECDHNDGVPPTLCPCSTCWEEPKTPWEYDPPDPEHGD